MVRFVATFFHFNYIWTLCKSIHTYIHMSIGRTSTFLTLFLIWHSHSCLWYLPISSCFLEVRNTVPDVAENCRNTHTHMYTLEGYTYTRIFHENTTRHPHCLSSLNRNRHLNLRHTYMCMYACRNHWLVPLHRLSVELTQVNFFDPFANWKVLKWKMYSTIIRCWCSASHNCPGRGMEKG